MITYTREEFKAAWGEEGQKKLVEALFPFSTPERKIELIRNPTVNVVYKDFVTIKLKSTIYLAITAQWWYDQRNGGRTRAKIEMVEFFPNQEEMNAAKEAAATKAIKLNQN